MARIDDLLQDLLDFEATPESHGLDLRLSLAEIILRALKRKRWTQKKLAEATGMKESFITRIIHSDQNCTFEVASRLLSALGVRAELRDVAATPYGSERFSDTTISISGSTYGEEEKDAVRFESIDSVESTAGGFSFGGGQR